MALVYKFGGASVKDADAVRNLAEIVSESNDNLIIVVSAMGKMTSALKDLTDKYFLWKPADVDFKEIIRYHHEIISELFKEDTVSVKGKFNELSLEMLVKLGKEHGENYDYEYDQIVPYGELFSSFIVCEYLNKCGIKTKFVDIRKNLKTDSTYRDAKVNWEESGKLVKDTFNFEDTKVYLTQGFIATDKEKKMTTLGLEGSDFTAAILAYLLEAEKVVVWKDVEGVYSSDPNEVENVTKLDAISYREAVELAYYGAKIIHPKTIKPLQNKGIPLYVKSFINPHSEGTVITESTPNQLGVVPEVPVFITKNNQILISIAPNDFSFITENCMVQIFSVIAKHRVKVNLMQNSAISFSVCVDNRPERVMQVVRELRSDYKVLYNDKLTLVTIRHYNDQVIEETTKGRKVFVQQKSRHTARFVVL